MQSLCMRFTSFFNSQKFERWSQLFSSQLHFCSSENSRSVSYFNSKCQDRCIVLVSLKLGFPSENSFFFSLLNVAPFFLTRGKTFYQCFIAKCYTLQTLLFCACDNLVKTHTTGRTFSKEITGKILRWSAVRCQWIVTLSTIENKACYSKSAKRAVLVNMVKGDWISYLCSCRIKVKGLGCWIESNLTVDRNGAWGLFLLAVGDLPTLLYERTFWLQSLFWGIVAKRNEMYGMKLWKTCLTNPASSEFWETERLLQHIILLEIQCLFFLQIITWMFSPFCDFVQFKIQAVSRRKKDWQKESETAFGQKGSAMQSFRIREIDFLAAFKICKRISKRQMAARHLNPGWCERELCW